MKIGYPCINLSLNCRSSRTFRLKNYSEERLIETITNNLICLKKILKFNNDNKILFFRITSDLIPFASHPIMNFNWQSYFQTEFREIGKYIKEKKMRISMHPGQYTVLNSKNKRVMENSIMELNYHAEVLKLLGLDSTAKIITHVGGVYGDKKGSIKRFNERYKSLDENIRKHYVIENDEKSYSFHDTLLVNKSIGIPVILDIYHHYCKNSGEFIKELIETLSTIWREKDGIPIIHYSSEHPIKGKCSHADHIDIQDFKNFIKKTENHNFDIMLEIKDKERSAIIAVKSLMKDKRFNQNRI